MIQVSEIPNQSTFFIQNLIDRSAAAYYRTGKALIEDATYDALISELKKRDGHDPRIDRVGFSVDTSNHLKKVRLDIEMGSLNNAMNEEEFTAWFNKFPRGARFHISPKMDGASLAVKYENGNLIQAVTRGDGVVGEDITANAFMFEGLPHKLKDDWSGWVRGEVVLKAANWESVDPEKSTNPRNLGNGIMRRKDGVGSEYLTFYAFDATMGRSFSNVLGYVASLGIRAVPYFVADTLTECMGHYRRFIEKRPSLEYWIDGVVFKVDDTDKGRSYGATEKRPKAQIAFKFPSEVGVTKVTGVVFTIGHTGAIIPTAQVEPTALGGTTVQNALLNNFEMIKEMDIAVGDKVEIIKAGDIIPKITTVIERPDSREPILPPEYWKGSPVVKSRNTDGSEGVHYKVEDMTLPDVQLAKLRKWVSTLDIQGLGDTLIEALWEAGLVRKIAHLYELDPIYLAKLQVGNGEFGSKRAIKIVNEISITRELTVSDFLGSLGIHLLGRRRVQLVQKEAPEFLELKSWLTPGVLTENAEKVGLPGTAAYIDQEIQKTLPVIKEIIVAGVKVIPNEAQVEATTASGALKICLTGKMSQPRKEIEELISKAGHIPASSVTGELDYLVMADPESTSSKAKKARKLGVNVISEEALMSILGS